VNKIPVWIDTDTGVDDAVALITAASLKQLDIKGVSAVAGNTTLENAFRNARDVLSLAGREDIKVYKGADKPLVKDLHIAPHVHGENGLGDAIIDPSKAPVEEKNAFDALYEKTKELNGELTIVAIGPLTNIATTIIKHPDFVNYVKCLCIMGGAIEGGNITPCAEFNIYEDPHGAQCVFKSGIKIKMFGLDVTLKAYLSDDDIAEIVSCNNRASRFFESSNKLIYAIQERHSGNGLCEHDTCPIVYLAHPELFTGKPCGIYVETQGEVTMGKTVADLYTDHKYEDRHCEAYIDINREEFVKIIKEAYKAY